MAALLCETDTGQCRAVTDLDCSQDLIMILIVFRSNVRMRNRSSVNYTEPDYDSDNDSYTDNSPKLLDKSKGN